MTPSLPSLLLHAVHYAIYESQKVLLEEEDEKECMRRVRAIHALARDPLLEAARVYNDELFMRLNIEIYVRSVANFQRRSLNTYHLALVRQLIIDIRTDIEITNINNNLINI
uniref:Uncharacterized protein n=1 Tax=Trichogramma kaykai TaxID=54128 RepID=A0ABD2WLM5_9HYME